MLNTRGDNLTKNVESVNKIIDEALKDIPADHVRQIGIIVVGTKGVEGMELFDHPDSWKAMSKGVIRNYGDILTKVIPDIFEINSARVNEYVFEFIRNVQLVDGSLVLDGTVSDTYDISSDKVEGEFVVVDGDEFVHLFAFPRQKNTTVKPKTRERTPIPMTTQRWGGSVIGSYVDTSRSFQGAKQEREQLDIIQLVTQKKGYNTLASLYDGDKSFSVIQRQTGMSSRTVSEGLKEASRLGLVEKQISDGGKTVYSLTSSGRQINPKKFKVAYE
jgi:DNA-binding HxlR family transcriptional regulator